MDLLWSIAVSGGWWWWLCDCCWTIAAWRTHYSRSFALQQGSFEYCSFAVHTRECVFEEMLMGDSLLISQNSHFMHVVVALDSSTNHRQSLSPIHQHHKERTRGFRMKPPTPPSNCSGDCSGPFIWTRSSPHSHHNVCCNWKDRWCGWTGGGWLDGWLVGLIMCNWRAGKGVCRRT